MKTNIEAKNLKLTEETQMLWNWNTVDACFISSTWKITSAGMFAGSCIGVILLVMFLELLRRCVKEFDRYLLRKNCKGPTCSRGYGQLTLLLT